MFNIFDFLCNEKTLMIYVPAILFCVILTHNSDRLFKSKVQGCNRIATPNFALRYLQLIVTQFLDILAPRASVQHNFQYLFFQPSHHIYLQSFPERSTQGARRANQELWTAHNDSLGDGKDLVWPTLRIL